MITPLILSVIPSAPTKSGITVLNIEEPLSAKLKRGMPVIFLAIEDVKKSEHPSFKSASVVDSM